MPCPILRLLILGIGDTTLEHDKTRMSVWGMPWWQSPPSYGELVASREILAKKAEMTIAQFGCLRETVVSLDDRTADEVGNWGSEAVASNPQGW